ncbi:OmpA family protein [Acidocella aminolytica]|jgi:outer membrane protein OmpA-like peptidoglycan-associated protein|nr:OmpA family protein [Acidocella aminolytica]SHE46143.1 OmpA family protein [Acidocella aminolytica 101 = DSM 11237]
MKKLLAFSMLVGLGGCASMGAPPSPLPPATPVFFQPFSAALDQAALNAIATAAKAASAQPNAPVVVVGAADSVGSKLANKYLSETRAQVVADQLVADGVAQDRLHIHAEGMIYPKTETPGTPAQGARRVLIQIGGE